MMQALSAWECQCAARDFGALRAALREDPDIVLVGEMRDLETTHIAIETDPNDPHGDGNGWIMGETGVCRDDPSGNRDYGRDGDGSGG